jgi:hypothetical protein
MKTKTTDELVVRLGYLEAEAKKYDACGIYCNVEELRAIAEEFLRRLRESETKIATRLCCYRG